MVCGLWCAVGCVPFLGTRVQLPAFLGHIGHSGLSALVSCAGLGSRVHAPMPDAVKLGHVAAVAEVSIDPAPAAISCGGTRVPSDEWSGKQRSFWLERSVGLGDVPSRPGEDSRSPSETPDRTTQRGQLGNSGPPPPWHKTHDIFIYPICSAAIRCL